VLVVDRATSAEHLYVGMTRGRHHNLACVITEPGGDEHTRRQPPTADQVLAAALRHTSSEKTATETLREELDRLSPTSTDQPAAGIVEGLRQAQRHSYTEALRHAVHHKALASIGTSYTPERSIDRGIEL
jgi:hypothetical protein